MKQFRASIFYILSTLEFLTAIKVYVNDIIDVAVSFYFCSLYYISCYLSWLSASKTRTMAGDLSKLWSSFTKKIPYLQFLIYWKQQMDN